MYSTIDPLTKLWIGGRYVDAASGRTFPSISPSTGEILTQVQSADESDVDKAVRAAHAAFPAWSALSGAERGRILRRAADLMRQHCDELAQLEVRDCGKPISEAKTVDIATAAEALEYYAGLAPGITGEHVSLPGGSFAYTRREPLGVCAGIGAWNYPLQIATWKTAPALACGNTMVFKPSELTPLSVLKLAELFKQAGLPDGVFNVVQGDYITGNAIVSHPDVAKVSFTGSVPTGKKIMSTASHSLKHVTLELGGKSPLLIFEDADLDHAVNCALIANFFTQGEVCCNGTRVFVHQSMLDKFLQRVAEKVRTMKIGNPLDPSTQVGALISRPHLDRVMGFVNKAKEEGAKLVVGGEYFVPEDDACKNGNFIVPTVFTACRDDMTFVKEEIFGPVMAVLSFNDESEVVKRANATPFGLAAGIITKDITRAHRVAAQLQAGMIWINNYNVSPIEIPFGGYKHSGFGRENGKVTIEYYTQVKSVYVEMGQVQSPF